MLPSTIKDIVRDAAAPWLSIYGAMPDGDTLVGALYAGMSDRVAELLNEPRIAPVEPLGQFLQGRRLADGALNKALTRRTSPTETSES